MARVAPLSDCLLFLAESWTEVSSSVSNMHSEYLLPILTIFSALSQVTLALEDEISEVVWTEVAEASLLTQEEHKVAFRDVVLEGVMRRVFNVFIQSSKLGSKRTRFPAHLLLKDPQVVIQDIAFKKKKQGLLDIDFKAWDLLINGLHNIRIKNLHVLRHIGLKDVRVVVQLMTDLSVVGKYNLEGTGLTMIPVTGRVLLSMIPVTVGVMLSMIPVTGRGVLSTIPVTGTVLLSMIPFTGRVVIDVVHDTS